MSSLYGTVLDKKAVRKIIDTTELVAWGGLAIILLLVFTETGLLVGLVVNLIRNDLASQRSMRGILEALIIFYVRIFVLLLTNKGFMIKNPGFITILLLLFSYSAVHGQVEVARLSTKGFSAIGFGGFINFALPVSEGSSITAEAGFYSFKSTDEDAVALVPFLLGYRYTFNKTGTGFYIEPTLGYSLGASDIAKYDENDALIPNATGDGWLEQQAKGPTAGIGTGYVFQGSFPLNIGLRYQRVFVSNDPALNMLSLRLSYPITFGRRRE